MNIVESIVNSAISSMPRTSASVFTTAETARVFSQLEDLTKLIKMENIKPIKLVENESINSTFDDFFKKLQWYLYTLDSDYVIAEKKANDISSGILSTSLYTSSALAGTYAFIRSEVDKITLLGKDYVNADYYNFSTKPNWQFDGLFADDKAHKLTLLPASSNDVQSSLSGVDAQSYSVSPLTLNAKADGKAYVTFKVSGPFNTLNISCNAPAGTGILLTNIVAIKNGVSTVIGPIKPVEMYSAYDTKIFLPYTDADHITLEFTQKYTTSLLTGNEVISYAPIIIDSISFKLVAYRTSGSATFSVNDSNSTHSLYSRRYPGTGDVSLSVNTGSSSELYVVSDKFATDIYDATSFMVTINMSTTDKYQTPVVKDIAVVRR